MSSISLYAIVREDGKFFGGFDREKAEAIIVDTALQAKLFSNKFDVNLRPDEQMVEVMITLSSDNTHVTAPFKPRRRVDRVMDAAPVSRDGGRRITD
jgi:hypothetical protein